MEFKDLEIIAPILRALTEQGYKQPSPIQEQAIPLVLAGKDLFGCAQTGTGKTAAFAVPILQNLYKQRQSGTKGTGVTALVLTPTRELAAQIYDSFKAYGRYTGMRTAVIFGGVGQYPQTEALRRGVDILVATPGRLLDLIEQGLCDVGGVSFFVLDEADRMLDMGFINDVKKVTALIKGPKQTLLFSATMPKEIVALANAILRNPVSVSVTPAASTVDLIDQSVYFVDKKNKEHLLIELLRDKDIVSCLIFSRTKHGANKICKALTAASISASAIHGDKSQTARQDALASFKKGKVRVLVATDIAARGLDIDQLSHVINYDIPNVPETYVHRIGRTGRAGARGVAISFCDYEEKAYLKDIQSLIKKDIPVVDENPYPMQVFEVIKPATQQRRPANAPGARASGAPARGEHNRKRGNFKKSR